MIQLLPEKEMTYDLPFVSGIKPYAHQVVQLRLIEQVLTQGRQAVIWNEALTGAGKTLANYSYLTKQPQAYALGVYPVNELIKDQFYSLQNGLPLDHFESIALWNAESLRQERMKNETVIDQLNRLSGRYTRSILTNPDYLMLISQMRLGIGYTLKGQQSSPFYRLGEYNLQIFDEFHLYGVPQVNILVQWIALMTAAFPNKAHAFVLSSATPRPEVMQLIERLGLEVVSVQDEVKRWLESENPVPDRERLFLEPLQLHFRSSQLHVWETSERILDNWAEVEAYLQQYPTAKGLIILDSIYEAQKLALELRGKGYDVGEVHGLADRHNSRRELAKQLTVATATVEVGVDFKDDIHKDFLIFEARNAGSFMQRIGRIARGDREQPEIPIQVWSYLHKYVVERVVDELDDRATRKELQRAVQHAFRRYQDFVPYYESVGGMNLVHSYDQLKSHYHEEENPVLQQLQVVSEKLYQIDFDEQRKQYQQWQREKILEPVISFRGQNTLESFLWPFQQDLKKGKEVETFYPDIWFWDATDTQDPLKRYDYQFVLSRRQVMFVPKEEIVKRMKQFYSGIYQEQKLAALKRDRVMGYALVTQWREKRAPLYWQLPFRARKCIKQVKRMNKLQLRSEDGQLDEQLNGLFQTLSYKSWIVCIADQPTNELIDTWSLPPFFRVHQAKTARGANWSIAFNNEAFQLWSLFKQPVSEVF